MMVYTMGFSIHTKIAVFFCMLWMGGWGSMVSVWFRIYNQYSLRMRKILSIIQVVDFLQASTDTLCSVVPFCLYKMGLVLLVFLNPVRAWVIQSFAFQNAMSNFTAENSSSEDNPCLFRMPLRFFSLSVLGRGT